MIAYVLLQVGAGKSGPVVTWLRRLEGVSEAYAIFGEHDVIAKVEAPDSPSLDRLIMETIQANPDVQATHTIIAMEGFPRARRRRAVGRPRRRARRAVAAPAPRRRRQVRRARRTRAVAAEAPPPEATGAPPTP